MNMNIITILAVSSVAVLAAGCHHHRDRDYYRPGPSHHYDHNNHHNGWHSGQNRPGPRPRPHYVTVTQPSYPRLYQLL